MARDPTARSSDRVFAAHTVGGAVAMPYRTRVWLGTLRTAR